MVANALTRRALIGGAVGLIGGLSACSGGSSAGPGGSTTLRISTWTAVEPGFKEWWPALVSGFEKKHPGVTVDVQQIAYADYQSQITTRLTAGEAPEIIHIPLPTTTLPAWAEAGFLADLGEYLADTDIAEQWPSAQAVMEWGGASYGVLVASYGYVLFYNMSLLEKAGAEVPTTPDGLLSAAQAVTEMSGDAFGFAITDDNTPNFLRDALLFVTGLGASIADTGRWTLTDNTVVEAFDLWRQLGKNYAPRGTDIAQKREAFLGGNAAMMIEGPFYYATVQSSADDDLAQSLKIAAPPFPVTPGDVSNGLAISEGLDDETRKLAEQLISYATSQEMMTKYSEMVVSPVARPTAMEALEKDPQTKVIAETAKAMEPIVAPDLEGLRADYAEFTDIAAPALHSLLESDQSTAAVLAELQKSLESAGLKP